MTTKPIPSLTSSSVTLSELPAFYRFLEVIAGKSCWTVQELEVKQKSQWWLVREAEAHTVLATLHDTPNSQDLFRSRLASAVLCISELKSAEARSVAGEFVRALLPDSMQTAFDEIRSEVTRTQDSTAYIANIETSQAGDHTQKEFDNQIRNALSTLSEQDRKLIEMSFLMEVTPTDESIAAELGMDIVEMRLTRESILNQIDKDTDTTRN